MTAISRFFVSEFERYKFTAKEYDEETGLYYYGARYYDAKLSRWCSADDRFDGLYSSQGQDVFAYVHGRPVMYTDPSGHGWRGAILGYAAYALYGPLAAVAGHYIEEKFFKDKPSGSGNTVNENKNTNANNTTDKAKQRSERIKQKGDGMDPDGKSAACKYRALQASVEELTGKNLTVDQINAATKKLSSGDNPALGDNYWINEGGEIPIINDTLERLGYDPSKYNVTYLRYGEEGYDTAAGNATFSLRGMESKDKPGKVGHWQLGDSRGNFLWDPTNGNFYNTSRKLITTQYIFIRPKDEE